MEDPGEEWEYEKFNDSPVESRKSSLSWLWSKGLWLGQKVLVTSFVISCAPLVLPPLLVVSALGFAVSVPAGIAIASYTCAEKLMNKLLPAAASRSMILEEKNGSAEQNQQNDVAEKKQGVVPADMCFSSTANIGEIEENEVSPAASFDKKYYAEEAGEYNGVENLLNKLLPAAASRSKMSEEEDGSVEQNQQIGVAEKEQGVVSADMCFSSTAEENEVSPAASFDKKFYAEDAHEYNGAEKIESHEINNPKIEDFGEEEVKEPTKETNSPIEVKESRILVQEELEKESPKKATNSLIEMKDVGTSVEEDPKKESPKKETNSPIEVKDVGILVQEDTKEEPTNKETDSPIEVKDVGTLVQEDTKKESPKKESNSPIEVKDVGILVQEEPTNKETDSPIEVKDVGTLVQEDPKKEPKKETNLEIEVKDVGTLVQEDPKKEIPTKETNSAIDFKDVGTLVQDPKKEQPMKETDSPIEVKDVGTLVQEDTKEKPTKKESDSAIVVKDIGTLVQEDIKEEPPKKETNLPIDVKNVGTSVQEDTKSADTNDTEKLAVPVMLSREAQGTAGKAAEVKLPEETTGVLKNTRESGISHEPSKKNKKKIKSSGLKTSHVVEGKKDHKTVASTKETGKSLEVGDEKLKMVDPNGLKADHIGAKGENTKVENLVPTVEMKKSVILESIVVEDRSTTMGDDKPIRYQSVSVIANQAGEDRHNVDENVKLGMGNKRTMKEIRIEDSAADDNFDKQKAIPASTKAKGTTGNVIVDKRRAGSVTGVPKDPVEKGFKTSKQDSGVHKVRAKITGTP